MMGDNLYAPYGAGDWLEIQKMYQQMAVAAQAKIPKGLTSDRFEDVDDADLMLELIARGYAVWKPAP
jgi:hypothetical protein